MRRSSASRTVVASPDDIVTEFRKSDFFRFLTQSVHNHGKEMEKLLAGLRSENNRLRKQLQQSSAISEPSVVSMRTSVPIVPDASLAWNTVDTKSSEASSDIVTCNVPGIVANDIGATEAYARHGDNSGGQPRKSTWSTAIENLQALAHGRPSGTNEDSHRFHRSRSGWRMSVAGVLPDADLLKDEIRNHAFDESEKIEFFYKSDSVWTRIATAPYFENITLVIIACNSIWIAIDTDYNSGRSLRESGPFFQAVEYFFFVYFLFEWMIRFLALQRKVDGTRDGWFVFDSVLLFLMILDLWVMQMIASYAYGGSLGDTSLFKIFRLAKLTRMARMARLLKQLPELVILIKVFAYHVVTVVAPIGKFPSSFLQ
jgi:hypothetical protein